MSIICVTCQVTCHVPRALAGGSLLLLKFSQDLCPRFQLKTPGISSQPHPQAEPRTTLLIVACFVGQVYNISKYQVPIKSAKTQEAMVLDKSITYHANPKHVRIGGKASNERETFLRLRPHRCSHLYMYPMIRPPTPLLQPTEISS